MRNIFAWKFPFRLVTAPLTHAGNRSAATCSARINLQSMIVVAFTHKHLAISVRLCILSVKISLALLNARCIGWFTSEPTTGRIFKPMTRLTYDPRDRWLVSCRLQVCCTSTEYKTITRYFNYNKISLRLVTASRASLINECECHQNYHCKKLRVLWV